MAATAHGINPQVVRAICIVESGLDPWATRFEPNWSWLLTPKKWSALLRITEKTESIHQATSWGLMQVMGTVAREEGYTGALPRLCIPEIGLEYGCRKLKKLIEKYKELPLALAAYNAGVPGTSAGRAYSDKVIAAMTS